MKDDEIIEFSGGILVQNYSSRPERIMNRFSNCECALVVQEVDGQVFENCHDLIVHCLTSRLEKSVMVSLYCADEYIALIFEPDGTLVVAWNVIDSSVEYAVASIEELQAQLGGEASFLVEGPWMIVNSREFKSAFNLTDGPLRRWGRLAPQ